MNTVSTTIIDEAGTDTRRDALLEATRKFQHFVLVGVMTDGAPYVGFYNDPASRNFARASAEVRLGCIAAAHMIEFASAQAGIELPLPEERIDFNAL